MVKKCGMCGLNSKESVEVTDIGETGEVSVTSMCLDCGAEYFLDEFLRAGLLDTYSKMFDVKIVPKTVIKPKINDGLVMKISFDLTDPAAIAAQLGSLMNDMQCCPDCGMSLIELDKHGKFGCAKCYDHYAERVEAMLKRCQKADEHIGKKPKRRLDELEKDLKLAIKDERYEDAAVIKQAIADLKETENGQAAEG